MKKSLCITALISLFMLTGCSLKTPNIAEVSPQPDKGAAIITFLGSMGCNDKDCTNASHYHNCPADCADYDHYHSCALDCSEAEHHHSQPRHQAGRQTNATGVNTTAFVSGMGCSDQSCTDVSHYHDCPPDCADYDHYHSCALDCSETGHHHSQPHHQDGNQTNATEVSTTAFVSGMGCSDQSCTDVSHYHDCPPDCADYDHYHSCALGCSETGHHHSQIHHQGGRQTNASGVDTTTFVSGMGCSDQSCTDVSHYHDCPLDCTDYNHYHNCTLGCAETNHHHGSQVISGNRGKHHGNRHH